MGNDSVPGQPMALDASKPNQFLGLGVMSTKKEAATIRQSLTLPDVCKTPAPPGPVPIPYPNTGTATDTGPRRASVAGLLERLRGPGMSTGREAASASSGRGQPGRATAAPVRAASIIEILQLHSALKGRR